MVEFRFDIKPLFPQPIVKVTSNLLPHTFKGDRRQVLDTTSKMSEIIDKLGELSAISQKLTKAVTSANKLRMSDNQKIYILADPSTGHNGAVLGILKVGTKSLYLFDEVGNSNKIDDTPCILDFYIHESRQRSGLGKEIFDSMLADEQWKPIKLSVDRPSDKLLGFMKKHYNLEKTIPQSNNFVLYQGFFENSQEPVATQNQRANGLHAANSPNTALFGAHYLGDDHKKRIRQLDSPSPNSHITQNTPVGRYAAPRPSCSMAEIIHSNSKPVKNAEPSSVPSPKIESVSIDSITENLENLQTSPNPTESGFDDNNDEKDGGEEEDQKQWESQSNVDLAPTPIDEINAVDLNQTPTELIKRPTPFQLSKQHTGQKNISFNVGMAVTPTNKMEFDQEQTDEFGILKINRPPGKLTSPCADNSDALSTVSSGEGFTDQGYYDLKFYHNKLW